MIRTPLDHVRFLLTTASLAAAFVGVSAPAVTRGDGSAEEGSLSSGSVTHFLAGSSLMVSLNPATAEDYASADRARELAANPPITDKNPTQRTQPAQIRSEVATLTSSSFDASRRSDPLPHSRVVMPLLVSGLLGSDSDTGDTTGNSNFRPLAGAVVGVRPSFLRPRVPGSH